MAKTWKEKIFAMDNKDWCLVEAPGYTKAIGAINKSCIKHLTKAFENISQGLFVDLARKQAFHAIWDDMKEYARFGAHDVESHWHLERIMDCMFGKKSP